MAKLLLILLFSATLNAATLVAVKHPVYIFDNGEELMLYVSESNPGLVRCVGERKDNPLIRIKYICDKITEKSGYIENCRTTGAI